MAYIVFATRGGGYIDITDQDKNEYRVQCKKTISHADILRATAQAIPYPGGKFVKWELLQDNGQLAYLFGANANPYTFADSDTDRITTHTTITGIFEGAPDPCTAPGCPAGEPVMVGDSATVGPVTATLKQTNLYGFPISSTVDVNGTEYTIADGTYQIIQGGKVGVFNSSIMGACIDIVLDAVSPTGPGPTPGTGPGTSTGPNLIECKFPEITANFFTFLSGLIEWLGCNIRNLITLIQWIIDWFLHFPDHLDQWVSRLFGIDPALPFWDELEKKLSAMIVKALSAFVGLLLPPAEFWKTHDWRKK